MTDKQIVTAPREPLFHFDAGWLFILAGLAVCIVGALASADRELQTLRVQQSLLQAEEEYAYARLRAHEDFLQQFEDPDAALTRRLAAQELNLMPADEEPVLRLITLDLPTVEWIDRTVARPLPRPVHANCSQLTELATGKHRLWVFGGGVFCVFLGLLMDRGASTARQRRSARAIERRRVELVREELAIELKPAASAVFVEDARELELFEAARGEAEPECLSSHVEIEDAVREAEVLGVDIQGILGEEAVEEEIEVDAADAGSKGEVEEDASEGFDEYELIADDVDLVEVEDALDDAIADAGDADDVFAVDESASEERGGGKVISIRPSMSVGAPEEVEPAQEDGGEAENVFAAARGQVDPSTWDDDGSDEDLDAESAARTRQSKSKRSRKRR